MVSNKIILALGIVCLVMAFCLWKSCQKAIPSVVNNDKIVDSVTKKAVRDSANFKKGYDSLSHKVVGLQKDNDSLRKESIATRITLKGKDKDIQGFIAYINSAEDRKDTAAMLAGCDSLKKAYPIAKGLVTQYININDSLRRVTTEVITTKDTIIGRLNLAYTQSNNSLFEVSRQYGIVTGEYKKVSKDAGNRFGIGPQVTVGVVGGKFAVVPGIGVHYTIIKF